MARVRVTRAQGPVTFALGSPQSGAAARALLERRFASREELTIILFAVADSEEPHHGDWWEGSERKLVRTCTLPGGMTLEAAERLVSRPERKSGIDPRERKDDLLQNEGAK